MSSLLHTGLGQAPVAEINLTPGGTVMLLDGMMVGGTFNFYPTATQKKAFETAFLLADTKLFKHCMPIRKLKYSVQ